MFIFLDPAISRRQVSQCYDPRHHGGPVFIQVNNLSDATVFPHFLQQTMPSAFCVFQSGGHTLTLVTTSSPPWLHPPSADQDPLITSLCSHPHPECLAHFGFGIVVKMNELSAQNAIQTDALKQGSNSALEFGMMCG